MRWQKRLFCTTERQQTKYRSNVIKTSVSGRKKNKKEKIKTPETDVA